MSGTGAESAPRIIARRLLQTHGIDEPPVPVEDLLSFYATVELAAFPATCDAFTDLRDLRAPHVYIHPRATANPRRLRFTQAHELGHVRIGWHTGLYWCDPSASHSLASVFGRFEGEAHAFASELLLPSGWLQSKCRDVDAETIVAVADAAEITLPAAVVGIAKTAAVPFVWHLSNAGGYDMCGRSERLDMYLPRDPSAVDWRDIARVSAERSRIDVGAYRLEIYSFASAARTKRAENGSSLLMRAIVQDHVEPDQQKRIYGVIHGVCGFANATRFVPDPSVMAGMLRGRFQGRAELEAIIEDPRFDQFIDTKSLELVERSLGV